MSSHPTSLCSAERALALLQAHSNTHQVCLSARDTSGIFHTATSVRQQRDKVKLQCRKAGPPRASCQLPVASRVLLLSDPPALQYRSANRRASKRFFTSQMHETF